MRDVVRTVGRGRQVTSLKFVLTLRACFNTLQPMVDGKFYCLIVARFEVQVFEPGERPPIPTV